MFSTPTQNGDKVRPFFLSRFAKMLHDDGFLVAEVNAWQDDHADDPLLSVMDAIDQAVTPIVENEERVRNRWNEAKRTGVAIAVAAAKGATLQIGKKLIGDGLEEIGGILSVNSLLDPTKAAEVLARPLGDIIDEQGKALLATFREGKRTIARFRQRLNEFLEEASLNGQSLPLFVLIDELDRCRPPFAIAMLERVKHLFEIDQVVFVIATDTEQLSHSIGAVYGGDFNSEGYLSRFFDRTYYFDRSSRADFTKNLLSRMPLAEAKISLPPGLDLRTYLTGGFDFFGLSLRDIEQVYDILRSVVTTWSGRLKIEMCLLFPVTVAHQQRYSLPLDHNFHTALNRLAQTLGGIDNWNIHFGSPDYGRPHEMASALAVANAFIAHATRSLNDLNHGTTDMYSQCCSAVDRRVRN